MDYVEWVDRVARSYAALRPGATKIIGLAELRAAMALGPEADDAIWTAIEDLDRGGILEIDSVQWIKETDSTRRLRAGARLENLWPEYFARFLEEDELAFLGALVEVAQSRG